MNAFDFVEWAHTFPNGPDLFCEGCDAPSKVVGGEEEPCDTCEVMEMINQFEDMVREDVTRAAEILQRAAFKKVMDPDNIVSARDFMTLED